jgi:hypothetical protein
MKVARVAVLFIPVLALAESPYKPGQEFPQTDPEKWQLSSDNESIKKCEAQKAYLQLQFAQIDAEEAAAKKDRDLVVGKVNQRGADQGLTLVYNEQTGKAGQFVVKVPEPAKK